MRVISFPKLRGRGIGTIGDVFFGVMINIKIRRLINSKRFVFRSVLTIGKDKRRGLRMSYVFFLVSIGKGGGLEKQIEIIC